MVFGTGTHETTQLCLAQLDEHMRPGMKVIDLGCGSGILSVAALLLGADRALGVDIDPNAVDIAYNNADENGIARDRYTVVAGNVLDDNGFVDSLGIGYDIQHVPQHHHWSARRKSWTRWSRTASRSSIPKPRIGWSSFPNTADKYRKNPPCPRGDFCMGRKTLRLPFFF